MPGRYLLFLSTNSIWGGSEVLWSHSIRRFAREGYQVKAGLKYDYELVQQFIPSKRDYIDLRDKVKSSPLFSRILQKFGLVKSLSVNKLQEELERQKPQLVIISQGNNIDGLAYMKDCVRFEVPFVTITHLVTEFFWPGLSDESINELRCYYQKAVSNYFVSEATLKMHEKLMGEELANSAVVYNPFTKTIPSGMSFPALENGIYKMALIGRIETFHKGYDLLIEILKKDKWKSRPVHFTLFGKGPHKALLNRLIDQHGIANFSIKEHIEDIAEIWKGHHMLIMPSRVEGQSLTLIEAMHFKRTAVVTDVGGTRELIEEGVNGFIAEYPSPEFIDSALERAWEKRMGWEQMGINAAEAIARKHPADPLGYFEDKIKAILAGHT